MGWVRRADVRLMLTRLRIVVRLRAHRLELRDGGRTVLRARIAVGRAVSPTPHGHAFVTDIVRPPDPHGFYGPYALGLSAHSRVYTTFEGGDGQVGIHGTNRPGAIGSDVSHGCIRVGNRTVTRLARRVPLGTPVLIEA
jgi:lipoprotein-anchoring transpeptidase ErfK/SrfK